jgi:hypothetical protein
LASPFGQPLILAAIVREGRAGSIGLNWKNPPIRRFSLSMPFKRPRIAGRLPNVPTSDVHCVIGCAGGEMRAPDFLDPPAISPR